MTVTNLQPLSSFVAALEALVEETEDEATLLAAGETMLAGLIHVDDWLPDRYAAPDPHRYQQYLLYRDPKARFSVVSFVWGPGQATPIHNHTVWGLVGVLRGAELSQAYALEGGQVRPKGPVSRLEAGQVEAVSPRIGDIHRVANAFADRTSISIHVYGADIGQVERSVFEEDGRIKRFVSGYAPVAPPELAVLQEAVG